MVKVGTPIVEAKVDPVVECEITLHIAAGKQCEPCPCDVVRRESVDQRLMRLMIEAADDQGGRGKCVQQL